MKIGIYQSAGAGLSVNQRLLRLSDQLSVQIENNIKLDLVLCPELFITGYNVGDDLLDLAQPVKGEFYRRIAELAMDSDCAIVYGYPEKSEYGLFNAVACVGSDGKVLANHRKQLNSPGSFEEVYFKPGDNATFFTYKGIKIALMICYEVEFPETVRIAAVNGAQLVLVPTALVSQWGVVAEKVVPSRAFENGVWLAYANHAGHENGFDYFGGSKIIAPNGEVLVDAGDVETFISANIDMACVIAAQNRLPYLRDYSKFKD